jgi:3-keto-5-aminohexanoate cleavage enzyme
MLGSKASAFVPHGRRAFAAHGLSKDKIVISAALNGVFTDPAKFDIPVTPEEMATAAHDAYNAGATIVHIHFRDQRPGKGHLPSWDPQVAKEITEAIRERTPSLIINHTTGTIGERGPLGGGELGPIDGPIACLEAGRPEIAALNSGSLNYLKTKADGSWAWPPICFQNPVEKVEAMVAAMDRLGIVGECECFDTGIVRSIAMFEDAGVLRQPINISLVMGVASGMPAKAAWLPLLVEEIRPETQWQTIAIGRADTVWPLLRATAELGGNVRTGMEDTFYRLDGSRATQSAQLIEDLVTVVREAGRTPATTEETRKMVLGK